ncbi:hypothetical protein K439DRAFT_1611067 [Ramaria rubella]|nr:hypothetical protein K439DRAFT_1611067 [Ramaria rubella]
MPRVWSSLQRDDWASMWDLQKHQCIWEKGVIDQTLADKLQERSNAFNAHITRDGALPRSPAINLLSHINNQPTISMNTDAILQAKQAVGPSHDSIIMGKISPTFGATTRSMSESVSMTELHADAVSSVNKYWEKTHDQTLMREDTELRWHGNRPLQNKTELMSISEFFEVHSSLPHASVYFENVPKHHGKIKGKRICLELWISEDHFDSCTDADAGKKKIKAQRSWNKLEESDFPKRAQALGPMESSFVFGKCPKLRPTEPKDHVRLQFAKCVVVEQTGEVEIEWKDDSMDAEGDLGRKPLAQGRSKQVYMLHIDDKTYVAK